MTDFVRGVGHTVSTGYTRPNDTTAYAAGDVVCDSTSSPTILTFTNVVKDRQGAAIIQSACLVSSASVATKPDFELWLFDTAITMDNDNAVFTPTDAEMLTCVGVIAFPQSSFKVGDATVGAGGNSICSIQNIGLAVTTTTSVQNLFGVLVVRNAYVPVAQEVFTIRLNILD